MLYLNAESIDLAKAHPDEAVRVARGELVEVLTPISKGWGTDLGVELTSLAVQVHGGMGYIEETGVAQHYRDIRIAPIYEGTNGIQAIDLVGRKLGLRDGGVIADFLAGIDATAQPRRRRPAASWPCSASGWREANGTLRQATEWLRQHGADEADNALAGATPYLRMAGIVTGGWLLTKSALAAAELLGTGRGRFLDRVPRAEAGDGSILRHPAAARRRPACCRRSPPAPATCSPPPSEALDIGS